MDILIVSGKSLETRNGSHQYGWLRESCTRWRHPDTRTLSHHRNSGVHSHSPELSKHCLFSARVVSEEVIHRLLQIYSQQLGPFCIESSKTVNVLQCFWVRVIIRTLASNMKVAVMMSIESRGLAPRTCTRNMTSRRGVMKAHAVLVSLTHFVHVLVVDSPVSCTKNEMRVSWYMMSSLRTLPARSQYRNATIVHCLCWGDSLKWEIDYLFPHTLYSYVTIYAGGTPPAAAGPIAPKSTGFRRTTLYTNRAVDGSAGFS